MGRAKAGLAGRPWAVPPILEMSGTFTVDVEVVVAAAGLEGREDGRPAIDPVTLLLDIRRDVAP